MTESSLEKSSEPSVDVWVEWAMNTTNYRYYIGQGSRNRKDGEKKADLCPLCGMNLVQCRSYGGDERG